MDRILPAELVDKAREVIERNRASGRSARNKRSCSLTVIAEERGAR